MKQFTKGFAAGMTALAIGIPALAHVALAASGDSAAEKALADETRPVPTQACTQAMADMATAHLDIFDQMSAERKAKMLEHRDALVAAAKITDDAQRKEAMVAMHEAMRDGEKPAVSDAITKAMEAVKTACGDTMKFKMGHGPKGGHGGSFMMKMRRGPIDARDATDAIPAQE